MFIQTFHQRIQVDDSQKCTPVALFGGGVHVGGCGRGGGGGGGREVGRYIGGGDGSSGGMVVFGGFLGCAGGGVVWGWCWAWRWCGSCCEVFSELFVGHDPTCGSDPQFAKYHGSGQEVFNLAVQVGSGRGGLKMPRVASGQDG